MIYIKKIARLLLLALPLVMMLNACSSNKESTSTPEKKEKWIHGVQSLKGDAGFQLMGIEEGYYEKLGIDFELMEFESDSTMLKALIAGEIDSMATTPSGALTAVSQGQDIQFVAATISGLSHTLFTTKDIKTIADLEGKVVGISGPGALPHVLTQALLEKNGLSDENVTYANAGGSSGRVQALIGGKVDAVISSVEFKPQIDADPNLHYIAEVGKELPQYIRVIFQVTGETAEKRGDALTKVLQAEAQGLRYAIENRDETLAVTAKTNDVEVDDPAIVITYDTHIDEKMLTPNLTFDPEDLKWMYDLGKKTGSITKDVDLDEYIDLSFAEKAIEEIGEYSW